MQLVQPADTPAVVRIVWPDAPTITTPARYTEVAAAAMKVLAEASTRLAPIRALSTACSGDDPDQNLLRGVPGGVAPLAKLFKESPCLGRPSG